MATETQVTETQGTVAAVQPDGQVRQIEASQTVSTGEIVTAVGNEPASVRLENGINANLALSALLVGEGEDDTLVQDLPEDVLEIIEAIQRGEDPNAIEDAATAAGAAASGSAITAMAIIEANGRIGEIIAGFQTEGITSPDGGITDEQLFALTALRLASADAVFPAAETNEAPSAESLTFSTDEDQPLVLTPNQILQQINDPDGDTLTIVSITSGNPDVEIDEDASGNIVITPPPNFNGDLDLTVIVSDGQAETPSDITVTVNPVNDAPTLQFSATTVTEDAVAAGDNVGTVTATDIEGDALTLSLTDGGQDYVELQGNNVVLTQAGVDAINNDALDIASLTFTITASDGETSTSQTFTSAVERIDDPASITGDTSGTLSEGEIDGSDGSLIARDSVSGTLSISDPDDNPTWIDSTQSGQYGELVFTDGNWTYTADSDAVQYLSEGDAVSDNFTVTASDGSSQVIAITITGTNDDPVISGQTLGDVVEDSILEATGSLSISDADGNNAPSFSDGNVSGQYGELSLVNGTWTYTLDNNSSVIQGLDAGDQITDTITLTASDGTQQDIVITIIGSNDAPEVTGEFIGSVTEGNVGDAAVTATGTIAISDVDDGDNPTFANTTASGTYGSLELVDGDWTYTLDQSAVQNLDAGDQVTDTITFSASDGTEQDIVITITGSEDAPEVSGEFVGSVTEGNVGDTAVTATGTIDITDVDDGDNPTFADTIEAGTYGSLELVNGNWTYTLDQSAVQNLDAGDQITDTITLTASDGTEQAIVITITGSEDAPVVSGEFIGSVTEGNVGDAPATATGTLAISDVDGDDAPSFANTTASGTYGSLELVDGSWTYTLDQSAVQNLDAGAQVTDTITLTASDGTEQAIVITITGSEDAPEVSGEFVGSVTEGNVGDAPVTATGTIAISDVDGDDTPTFADTTASGTYGSLELVDGDWTYTLDQSAVQDLDAGDQVNDTITLTASDGTQQDIVITITGTDDDLVVSGEFVGSVTEGNVGDAPVTATGTIAISDVDGDDNPTFADVTEAGTYGSLELVNGSWTYTLEQSAVQNLDAGVQVTDTITLTASDGTQQDIVITITGSEDAPEVTGEFIGSVTEGNVGDAAVTATGTIAISDIDNGDNPTFADTTEAGTYGSLELVNGNWTYTLDQSAVQNLDAGDQVTDTITLIASDGTEQDIIITITGTDDAPVVSGEFVGSVTEGNVGDAPVTTTGTIAINDVDDGDNPTFANTTTTGTYGSLELVGENWTYTLDQSAVQNLDAGDQITDTITLTASDGTEQDIVITITGSEDAPEVTGNFTGSVTEGDVGDSPVTATGTIDISDVDDGDNPTFANTTASGTYGSLELVGEHWTYTLDQSAVQNLDAGDQITDTITLTASDGTEQDIVITITGTDDDPVVSGEFVGSVTEGNEGDAAVTASGTTAISDVDGDDTPTFADTTEAGTYGSLELVNGNWTYTLDQSAVQNLDAGDQVTDTITLTASDGTEQAIAITITGTNDDPEVTGGFVGSVTEGNEGDAPVTAKGTLAISDVDGDDNPTFANTTEAGTYGSLELVGENWTYTLDQSAVQNLDAGDQVTDTITLTASDGTEQDIVITITGTDDAPEVTGEFVGSVTEGNVGDAPVTTTGTIAINDVDDGDNPTFANTTATGTYGSLELVGENWTYTLDQASVQNLDAGEQVTDTITLTASDGTEQAIVITITGSEDAPVITGDFTGSVVEGDVGDDPVTASGSLTITDADGSDTPSFPDTVISGDYGELELVNGQWTYTLDQTTVQSLAAAEVVTDEITVTASDNSQQTITITITGTAEAHPSITGTFTGSVTEGDVSDSPVTATGTIQVNNAGNTNFLSVVDDGDYGQLVLNGDNTWTYTLDQAAVQHLDNGQSITDVITVAISNGVEQAITITITGTNDAPILTQAVSTQTLQEDFVSYTIDLNTVFSDVDSNDTLSFDVANVPSGVSVSIDASGIATISSVADWSGTETVSFRATDTQNASLTHDVIFNIEGVATAPTLTVSRGDQSLTYIDSAGQISATDPGAGGSRAILSPLTISGTANETSETLTYRISGLPDDAVLSAGTKEASSGDWLLTDAQLSGLNLASPADITGITLSITAISTDGTDQASTTVTLNLENDSFALTEGQTSSIASVDGLISNDTDTQATVTRVATNASQGENGNSEIVIGPATITTALGGSVTVNADGSFTYTAPAVNHAGGGQVYDSFSYQSSENSEWTTVTFDVSDSAPVAHDDSDSVASGASTGGNVITAGTGADTLGADTTTVSAVSFNGTTYAVNGSTVIATSQGQLTIQPDGSYLYQSSVPSTTDASTLDDEIFTYTLTDSDGDTSQAQLTLGHDNNTQLNADIASVSEQGLVSDDNSHTTQGNLLDNDTGIGVNVSLHQINGQSFGSDGVLTLTTASGTLTVYNQDNSQGYRAGDYTYTLNNATSGDNVSEAFTYTTYDPTASTAYRSSTLTVNVQDDTPTSDNIESALYATAESSSTFNLILTVDLSGSMADPVDPSDPDSPTRMEVTKAALKSMVEEYDKLGDINIQVVSFSDTASSSGWILNDVGSALDAIEGLYAGGATRYDNALNEIINSVDTSGLTADKTISYFISDGMPNDDFENNTSLQSAWQNYISTQGIDESFSVGVGNGITTSPLTPIAASSSGDTSDNVLLVTDENELAYSLLQTIESGQVSGGLVLTDDDGNTVSLFGADGGYISALTLDGQTYNYDPATDSAQQTFETEKGGILTINFDTGEYDYRVAVDRDILNEQEQIVLTLTDNDGDTSDVNVAINLYYEARLDANHDIVITNIHDGSPIVIPGLALTHNDIPSMGSTITATSNAVQGSVSGTDDVTFTPDSAMSPQTFLDPIGNDSEFIEESELGDFANSFAQAQSLDRGKFGTMTQEVWAHIDAGNYGANAALTGTVRRGYDADLTKMDLYENETLTFDDDVWGNNLTINVYDENQQLIQQLNPDNGTSDSFTSDSQGTYYFQVVSNNLLNVEESYEIYLTLDSSNAVLPEPEHQFEYTTSNGSYVDSALVDIIAIDDQTLEGGYQSEILAAGTGDDTLIGNEGDDSLLGNHGDDTLDGGLGDDLLIGGKGDDTLTGGLGSDTFAFLSGDQGSVGAEAVDRITDFDVQKDTLDLSELLIDEDQTGASLEDYLTLEDNDQGEATLYIASAGDNQIDQHVVFESLSVADMAAAYEIDISGLSSQELSASVIDAMIQQSKLMTD